MNSLGFEISPLALVIGWTIVHTLWQSMVVAIGLKIALSIFSNRFSNVRYILSCMALAGLVGWTSWTFYQEWQLHQDIGLVAFELPASSTVLEPFGDEQEVGNRLKISYPTLWKTSISDYIPFITGCWFLGALCFALWLTYGFFRLQQLQRKGIYPTPPEWKSRLMELSLQMGISRSVQLLISDRVAGPITFRLLRPIILMPVQLFTGLSTSQIEILLLHELAHIRRYDYVVNLFQSVIEVLFFYHPAIWWINRQIRLEREHCCDDLVLRIQNRPDLYARVLTNVQITHFSSKTKLAMSANQNRGHFTTRVHRLFGKYESTVFSIRGVFIALLLVSGLLVQELSAQQEVKTTKEQTISTENIEKVTTPTNEQLVETEILTASTNESVEESVSEPVEEVIIEAVEEEEPVVETTPEAVVDTLPKDLVKAKKKKVDLPSQPEPGKCYSKSIVPNQYEEVTETYFIYTGDPAKAPANAIKETIEIKPAGTKWVKKQVAGKECMSKDPEDCKVWCLTDVPAVREEVLLLKNVENEADFERRTITRKVLKKGDESTWLEVLCPSNTTPEIIGQVQAALQARGLNGGSATTLDNTLKEALKQYQEKNKLPIGGLNMKTLQSLGISIATK